MDNLAIYTDSLPVDTQSAHHVGVIEDGNMDKLAAKFVFDGNLTSFVPGAGITAFGNDVAYSATAVPWVPPTVLAVEPTDGAASGETRLEVTGANFANSRYLAFQVGSSNLI